MYNILYYIYLCAITCVYITQCTNHHSNTAVTYCYNVYHTTTTHSRSLLEIEGLDYRCKQATVQAVVCQHFAFKGSSNTTSITGSTCTGWAWAGLGLCCDVLPTLLNFCQSICQLISWSDNIQNNRRFTLTLLVVRHSYGIFRCLILCHQPVPLARQSFASIFPTPSPMPLDITFQHRTSTWSEPISTRKVCGKWSLTGAVKHSSTWGKQCINIYIPMHHSAPTKGFPNKSNKS